MCTQAPSHPNNTARCTVTLGIPPTFFLASAPQTGASGGVFSIASKGTDALPAVMPVSEVVYTFGPWWSLAVIESEDMALTP